MKRYLLCLFGLLMCACAGSMQSRLDDVREDFATGEFAAQKINDKNMDPLLHGNALFQQNRFAESDAAFEEINKRMPDAMAASVFGEIGKALSSQMAGSYKPFFMDGLFVSYYQLWDALAMGRFDDARVIINQSYARQQEMSREFASLISARKDEKPVEGQNDLLSQLNQENSQWRVFSDIMNPALTYLAGLYFLNAHDFETARTYLIRADGMVPGNEFIRADLAAANTGRAPSNTAWVFIESGFAPKLIESRIDVPVFISNGIRIVSIAVAEPFTFPAPPSFDGARMLADVDAMFMTEFSEYQANAALRALASAVSKLGLQTVANKQLGPLAGLAAAIYSAASTGAEVRNWATLPKRIYILRIDKSIKHKAESINNERLITLKSGGRVLTEINVPEKGNHLIYVRFLGGEIEPKIIQLKG